MYFSGTALKCHSIEIAQIGVLCIVVEVPAQTKRPHPVCLASPAIGACVEAHACSSHKVALFTKRAATKKDKILSFGMSLVLRMKSV